MRFEIVVTFVIFFLEFGILAQEYAVIFQDIQVRNCLDEKSYKKYPWPRRLPFEMSAFNTKDTDIETSWELYSVDTNKTQRHIKTVYLGGLSVFYIEPFELKKGDYKVEISNMVNDKNKTQGSCYLRIQAEDAIAIITGGTSRNFNPGEDITLDGELSLDFCNVKENKSLTYKWNCRQIDKEGFCANRVETGSRFLIPGKYVVDKEVFRVNLAVQNEDGRISVTYQKIVVKNNSSHFSLACLENCLPIVRSSNVKQTLLVAVECEKYCQECKYDWSMHKRTNRTTLIASSGNCTISQCRFETDFYKEIGTYEIVFSCTGESRTGQVSLVVTFQRLPYFTCNLNKNSGTSYDPFQVFCKHKDQEIKNFEIFSVNNETGDLELITSWVPPFLPTFRIAPYVTKICVRATNYQGLYDEMTLEVVITPFLDFNGDIYVIDQLESVYFDNEIYSVRYALDTVNNVEEAISKIRSIWTCMDMIPEDIASDQEYKDFIHNFKLYVIDDLEKIPITTYGKLSEVANILQSIILYQTPQKTNPVLANSLTTLCKKLAYDMKQLLEGVEHSKGIIERTLTVSNIFLECGNKNANENYDLMVPLPIEKLRSVNESSIFLENRIIEDYDNYEDFDNNYYKNLENLMEAVSNTIKTSFVVGESIVGMIPNGTKKRIKDSEDVTQLVYKQYGYEYPKIFELGGVSVTVSEDIFTYEDTIFFSLSAWRKNIFWFSSGKTKPITYIVNIDLVKFKTNDLIAITAPCIITLKITRDPVDTFRIINGEISAPLIYKDEELDVYNRKYMKVYTVNLFRYQTLLIEFYDIDDNEFNVVIKDFEVPSYKDIKSRFTVFNRSHSFGYYENNFDHDSIFYVVILPNKSMLKNANDTINFTFKISFAGISCFSWNFSDEWTRACKAGKMTNKTHISCECNHFSILSGYKEHVRYGALDEHHLDFDSHGFYTTFCCVTVLFTIFCILFSLSTKKNKSEIYYAADNLYDETYAYLLMIRTGGIRKTTVRVVIKIVGTLNNTTHVLNYPDPECKIFLNGGEDWIIATTKQCLGNITSIILWHDNYGIRPLWVCHSIIIYDMQTYDMWIFKVHTTISAFHHPMVVKTPEDAKPTLKGILRERHSWNILSEDVNRVTSYTLRLTLLYSKLLTPLCLSVYCYCFVTRYEIKDESVHSDLEWFCFTIAILSGFISFMAHCTMRCLFSNIRIYIISLNVIVHTTTGVMFSFSVPLSASILIITGWLLGMFADIFIYENATRFIMGYFSKSVTKRTDKINFELVRDEQYTQREFVHERFGMSYVRQLAPMHKYGEGKDLEENQYNLIRRQEIRTQINEILMFGIYVILLYATVLTQKDDLIFYNHRTLKFLLKGDLTRTTPNIFKVNSLAGINDYINDTLIEAMHPETWYGNMAVDDPGVLVDYNTKFIGIVRIRQHRVKKVRCKALDFLPFLVRNFTCYPDYSQNDEETGTYDGHWTKPITYVPLKKRMWAMWTYKYSHEVGHYRGFLATYSTGGYTAALGRSRRNSHINYNIIKNSSWIDRATRTVIIEFLTYNPNHNLFASVLIMMERSASGFVQSWAQIRPQRMVFLNSELFYTTAIVTVGFAAWIGLVVLNRTKALLKKGLMSLKNFWNALDLIIILLSVTLVVIYAVRIREVRKTMYKLSLVEHNGFVVYYHVFLLSYFINVIEALLVFASTVRLWKLLRFMKMFQILEKTLVFAGPPLIVLFLYHNIIFHGFTLLSFMCYGESLKPFESHKLSQITLLRIYLTNFFDLDPYEFYQAASAVGVFLMAMYMIISYPIMQIYVLVEMFAYMEANAYYSEMGGTYSLIDYIKEEVLFYLSIYRTKVKRLRGGVVTTKGKVTRKSSHVFYVNCLSTTSDTMVRMSFVAHVVLLNILQTEEEHRILSKWEIPQMLQICRYIFRGRQTRGETKQIFFKQNDHTSPSPRVRVIDARRLAAARRIAEMILIRPEERGRTKEELIQDYDAVLEVNKQILEEFRIVMNKCLNVLRNIEFVRV